MIIQLTPDTGKRTYEHERVYIVANRKALESHDRLSKLCKCVQRIYGARIVQIKAIVKRRAKSSSQNQELKGSGSSSEKPGISRMPADDEDDGHTLLQVRRNASQDNHHDPERASASSSTSPSRAFFKTMKKRNVTTCINELHKLEQREQFSRPVSYLYSA